MPVILARGREFSVNVHDTKLFLKISFGRCDLHTIKVSDFK
jgi:hypothetical protein